MDLLTDSLTVHLIDQAPVPPVPALSKTELLSGSMDNGFAQFFAISSTLGRLFFS